MARFNLDNNVEVTVQFIGSQKMNQLEIFELYVTLVQEAEILYDRKNHQRRCLIIKYNETGYVVSVIRSVDATLNSLLFISMDLNNLELKKEDLENQFLKELC